VTREVIVVILDTVPPVITLNGQSTVTLVQGTAYIEAGASATDNIDGDVNVTTTGTVDINTPNIYTITYTAIDSENNTGMAARTVVIVSADNSPPVITLNGEGIITLAQGTTYIEAGASATDDVDGSIEVIITGNVDVNTLGNYTITYTATDSSTNTSSLTRAIIIVTSVPDSRLGPFPGPDIRATQFQPLVAEFNTSAITGGTGLIVSFDAAVITNISYSWNYGDGFTATGSNTSHTYNNPGIYTVSLTVIDISSNSSTFSKNVYVLSNPDNTQVTNTNVALFSDDFEYDAARNNPDVESVFQAAGWSSVKTAQNPLSRNPRGYVYTTTSIPGYSGPFPGANSNSVLAVEALPSTMGDRSTGNWADMQTDFYLKYGNETSSLNNIPADVWFQFWVYPTGNYDHGMKFIYPCRSAYPCQDLSWLFATGSISQDPHYVFLGEALNSGSSKDQFLQLQGFGANYNVPSYWWGGGDDLGQRDLSDYLPGNRWTKVKIHMDTSGSQGIYEAWVQPFGGQEVKVAEWIGDVTADFTWPISNNNGHRQFAFPTTVGGPRALDVTKNFDSITYMDDFVMAVSEAELPNYF
ncbi:MAG: immunoglobulin-like domain-containing protein, partial [Thiohalomonadales bacterium]